MWLDWDTIVWVFLPTKIYFIDVVTWVYMRSKSTTFKMDCLSKCITEACLLILTHWGGVTHICVSNLSIIGSDIGLSPDRRQAIICTNAGLLLIEPLGTNFSEILIEIHTFSFKEMHLKISFAKWRPFCLGLNVLSYNSNTCHMPQNTCDDKLTQYWFM